MNIISILYPNYRILIRLISILYSFIPCIILVTCFIGLQGILVTRLMRFDWTRSSLIIHDLQLVLKDISIREKWGGGGVLGLHRLC